MSKAVKYSPYELTLFESLWMGAISLVLGFGVWLLVKQQDTGETLLTVPVRAVQVPDFVEVKLEPAEMAVLFTHPRAEERWLVPNNFVIEVDLRDIDQQAGIERFTTGRERVLVTDVKGLGTVPKSIQAATIRGSSQVTWEALLRTRVVPVVPQIVGTPAPGFRAPKADDILIEPSEVRVLLTAAEQQRLRDPSQLPRPLTTEPLRIEDRLETFSVEASLEYPQGASPLPGSPITRVRVTVPLEELISRRTITGVPVEYQPLLRGLRASVSPPQVDVEVQGPQRVIDALSAADLVVRPSGVSDRPGLTRGAPIRVSVREAARRGVTIEATPGTTTVDVTIHSESEYPDAGTGTPAADDRRTTPGLTASGS